MGSTWHIPQNPNSKPISNSGLETHRQDTVHAKWRSATREPNNRGYEAEDTRSLPPDLSLQIDKHI